MTAAAKRIVLVTGSNGGIGFELAHQLMAKGTYHVLMCSRSVEKGNAAIKELQSRDLSGSIELLHLDVTSDETIERAAKTVESRHGKLDVLVNNAADAAMTPPLRDQLRIAFDTNATGPAVVTQVFTPLLKKSTSSPRVINITSGMGSLGRRFDAGSPMFKVQQVQYRASKCALSMVTACSWAELEPQGIKVFAIDPGFTISNLGPHNKAENGAKEPKDAVMPIIDVIEGKRDDESGKMLHNTGQYPW